MNVVLFEDSAVEQLFPITLSRPAYAVTCGSLRLIDLAQMLGANVHGVVRDYMQDFQRDYFSATPLDSNSPTLWLNARLVPDAKIVSRLKSAADGSWCVMRDGHVAVARTEAGGGPDLATSDQSTMLDFLACQLPAAELDVALFEFPHDVIASHLKITVDSLETRIAGGDYEQIADGVFAAPSYQRPDHVAFETANGPVVIENGVSLGAFSVVRGPVYLGRGAKIAPHALLKGPVCIGHTTKVGGEVSGSIIEPFTNKSHFGYLGSSYVGSWVNLGAGTTNSNLKNTYGSIRVKYGEQKIDTGMQFLGCVIGDYSKTAINSSIYTGKMIGVCSNIYGAVTTNVPSFANYARSFGEVTEHPVEVMKATQKRVFDRRDLEQEPRHLALLRAMYAIESPKRKLADQPPSL